MMRLRDWQKEANTVKGHVWFEQWIAFALMFQAFSILTEARDEDVRKRETSLKFYSDAEECLQKMDDKFIALLEKNVVNIQEKKKHHQAQLERKEYFLLVAGKWRKVVPRKDFKIDIWHNQNFVTWSRL